MVLVSRGGRRRRQGSAAAVSSSSRRRPASGGEEGDGELRKLSCTRNPLGWAHGSARWEQGDTMVVAAVYGPRARWEKASVEVVWKP